MTDYKEFEHKMTRTCENLSATLATIRAGRANAAVLDQITVDYYGVPTPMQQVASVAAPDPRSLAITPWDQSVLKGIENAIRNIRRDAIEKFKKQQKASEITEDDYKIAEKDIQKLTDDFIKEIDKITEQKEKELTEI